jgi:hypothetical protein
MFKLLLSLCLLIANVAMTEDLVDPQSLKLSGLERQSSFNSALGPINLRWTRESERLFGKTPERAVIEASKIAAKALRQSSLAASLKFTNINWNIVFLSKDLPAQQIPSYLEKGCHPGWMKPPANIYISSEKVAGICNGSLATHKDIADEELERVILHELAHALEFKMASNLPFDRFRSEGFASWFEVFAAKQSGVIGSEQLLRSQKNGALAKLASNQQAFMGSFEDYALAACIFHVFLEGSTLSDLTRLYQTISHKRLPLIAAIKEVNSWSDKELDQRLLKFLRS